jgi:sec-independent protein translocase protein TatC
VAKNSSLLDASMPFLDHLEELRRRLFYCAIALAVGGLVAWALFEIVPHYYPAWDPIDFLKQPVTPYLPDGRLTQLAPGETFSVMLSIGFWIAFVIASPVILYQLWGFVAPAMYQHEKRIALPVVLAIVVLFVLGVMLAFTLILPLTLRFLLTVGSDAVVPQITITFYFGFATYLCLGFGLMFELPIVIMGLTAVGLANPEFLSKYRRYAFVGCLVGATFITPDPTSMFVIAIPIYILFELSILLSRLVVRAKARRANAEDDESGPDDPSGGDGLPSRGEPRRLGAPA